MTPEAVAECPFPIQPMFCNFPGPEGRGCPESWPIGGPNGANVCRNPLHHDRSPR